MEFQRLDYYRHDIDRLFVDRVLLIDYKLIRDLKNEERFIDFLGPIIDNYCNYPGYRIAFIVEEHQKNNARKRLSLLCFDNEDAIDFFTIKELKEIQTFAKFPACLATTSTFAKLKKNNICKCNAFVLTTGK